MIECYKEDDFLKPFRAASGLWYFKYEDLLINVASPAYEIGLCQNSIPLYCRCGNVNDAGNSLLHEQSWQHDNVEQYNQQCPKCGWGVYAFLAGHGRLQDDGCIRFYDDGSGVLVGKLYELYFNQCKAIYERLHENDYKYYRDIQDYGSLNNLDEAFVKEHLAFERANTIRTEELGAGSVDSLFFGGGLKSFAGGYADWVADIANLHRTKGVVAGCFDEGANKQVVKQRKKDIADFRDLIQGDDKDMLMNKLHSLLDGKGGKYVALCLIRAKVDTIIYRYPTEGECEKEFTLSTTFEAVRKYLRRDAEDEIYLEAMQVRIID